jgi:Bacterial Ig-like domain/Domain of unknown function DUF11
MPRCCEKTDNFRSGTLGRSLLFALVMLGCCAGVAPSLATALSRIEACGTISGNVVWTADNLYVLNGCGVTVAAGGSLTIQPGTIVKLAGSHDQLVVNGTLLVNGTAGAPVVLTSLRDDSYGGDTNGDGAATQAAPGDWGWILFNTGASGRLSNAVIGYGGVGNNGYTHWATIKSYGVSDLVLDHVTLHDSWADGLYAENASVAVTNSRIVGHGRYDGYGLNYEGLDPEVILAITDNEFETKSGGQKAARIKLGNHPGEIRLQRNTATGNGWNGIVLDGTVQNNLLLDVADSIPFIVPGTVGVATEATLTVSPGTVFKPTGCGGKIIVDGSVVARGTADHPIVITSLNDDTRGGDTNGDGTASAPAPADWGYIRFKAGSTGALENLFVGYGGVACSGYDNYSMLQAYGASLQIEHATLQGSYGNGLYAEGASVSVTHSRILGNGRFAGSAGLYYNGLDPDTTLEVTDNVFETWAPLQHAGFLSLGEHPDRITLQRNSASGNGWNGIIFGGQVLRDLRLDVVDSVPFIIQGSLGVAAEATLTLSPGTVFKPTGCGGKIVVDGTLVARGTADGPIVFTSLQDDTRGGDTNGDGAASTPQPADWGYVRFRAGSTGMVDHSFFGYGGVACSGYDTYAMLQAFDAVVDVEHTTFDAYRWNAVYSSEARLTIHYSSFPSGLPEAPMAIRNAGTRLWVNAGHNWWGDASGPHHPATNPGGSGAPVTDRVSFLPWAIDESGTEATQVLVSGPTRVSPGDTAEYAVSYYVAEPIENGVLVANVPWLADYVDGTGDAIHWPERNQVYWRLGHVDRAEEGTRSFRMRYAWGLQNGSRDNVLAQLAAANLGQTDIDVAEYFAHEPQPIVAETLLSDAELAAEIRSNGELETLFQQATGDGFLHARGTRTSTSTGETITEILMINPDQGAATSLNHIGDTVLAITYDRLSFRAHNTRGGMQWDLSTDSFKGWGEWNGQSLALQSGSGAGSISFFRCFFNCAAPKLTLALIKKSVKLVGLAFKINSCFTCGLSKGSNLEACTKCENAIKPLLRVNNVPVLGETIDMTKCAAECAGQQGVVFPCAAPLLTCDSSVTRGVWSSLFEQCNYRKIPCEDGLLVPEKSYVVNSGDFTDFSKCVEGKGCVRCSDASGGRSAALEPPSPRPVTSGAGCRYLLQGSRGAAQAAGAACHIARTDVRVAHDPNAKLGIAGDIIPGQTVTYTITYENEGTGQAYGVYITDELAKEFDESTLTMAEGSAQYTAAARMILWDIGELAPKGEPGSKGQVSFSVKLKTGLPSGTVIANRAVVYFPSVPEETPTNTVVNVVQPLAAVPQSLETTYGQPIAITLSGSDVSGTPLSYAIKESPLSGDLTGTPPALTYTPGVNFTGMDRLTFTVSNGTSESRAADVTILVKPSPADTISPEVTWTYPENSAALEEISVQPIATDDVGPAYAPSLLAGFSEALDPATVTDQTITLADATGKPVAVSVVWDGTTNQAVIVPRERWRRTSYTLTVTTSVKDASGNPLLADYAWNFSITSLVGGTCIGDCDSGGQVTVDELLATVNIALGNIQVEACKAGDANGDRQITVDEILTAVNSALNGCVLSATPIPTSTMEPSIPARCITDTGPPRVNAVLS